mmetsp:Transcript_3987/g.14837  ORF Transcript_3987/g.14837 Transcript_3987/m.14837 type:complete len:110 (-) Transcript_3987:2352-2681(-)
MHGRGHLVIVRVAKPPSDDMDAGAAAPSADAKEAEDPFTVLELMKSLDAETEVVAASAGALLHKFSLPTASLSTIFRGLTAHQERLGIVDFTVTQTELEDVFLGFARDQ